MINNLGLAKTVVGFIVGAGTTKIVSAIVKNNISPEKITDQVAIAAGACVLGAMAADASKQYTDAKIDQIAAYWTEEIRPMWNNKSE